MSADGSSQGNITQTDFGYTGQRDLDGTGLMDYKARFYDGSLGRFLQPDTIVPGAANPQAWNRYTYSFNNPINFNDPDGHNPFALLLASPVVPAMIMVALVLSVAHVVVPGKREREEAFARGVETGIEQMVEMTKRTVSAAEKKLIKMTTNPSGSGDPEDPLYGACKPLGMKIVCGTIVAGIFSKMITSGANGELEANSHIVLPSPFLETSTPEPRLFGPPKPAPIYGPPSPPSIPDKPKNTNSGILQAQRFFYIKLSQDIAWR